MGKQLLILKLFEKSQWTVGAEELRGRADVFDGHRVTAHSFMCHFAVLLQILAYAVLMAASHWSVGWSKDA